MRDALNRDLIKRIKMAQTITMKKRRIWRTRRRMRPKRRWRPVRQGCSKDRDSRRPGGRRSRGPQPTASNHNKRRCSEPC